jgi:hydrogenase maturation protease
MSHRVLVAGLGNVFLGDDAFGVEVARRLARRTLPAGVRVLDAGIRSLHLAYDLLDRPDLLLVVDAVSRGGAPGSLYVLEPALDGAHQVANGHRMDLHAVKAGLLALGGQMPRVLLVGCEPARLDEGMGLTSEVESAVGPAMDIVCKLVARELSEGGTA